MTGRVYLDWNASAPLRPEARAAAVAALDLTGNPSSVHGDGRRVKAVMERARIQVAEALGAASAEVVFTSGATEAAALGLAGQDLAGADVEHDCVAGWTGDRLGVDADGLIAVNDPAGSAVQAANSETGVIQALPQGVGFVDAVQALGKIPFAFDRLEARRGIVSAHKIGGPRGIGALVLRRGVETVATLRGGGQEMGRRPGTENIAGIAGFGAACAAAMRDLNDGVWEAVAERRDFLEAALEDAVPDIMFMGRKAKRLPNTSCFAVPGWKGETQVMQMDLAGFAVSAGSACSSGKVRASRVLRAMGYAEDVASAAIRVSIGPETTRDDLARFAQAWAGQHARYRKRAA